MASQAPKRDVIIAIDFGTTYSGFGYVFLNASEDHVYVFQKWGRGQGMSYSKTPTALLLTEKGDFHKFGHAAVETYGKQATSKKDIKQRLYFDKFKLLLHSEKVGSLGYCLKRESETVPVNPVVQSSAFYYAMVGVYLGAVSFKNSLPPLSTVQVIIVIRKRNIFTAVNELRFA